MADPALTTLVNTLLDGTEKGTIAWQEATGDGNSFVTRTSAGTVTIQRRRALPGGSTYVALVARDSLGKDITEMQSSLGLGGLVDAVVPAPVATAHELETLFATVSARYTGDHPAIQALISSFEQSD